MLLICRAETATHPDKRRERAAGQVENTKSVNVAKLS